MHSIDYYNTCEYPSEDDMPNRCGMIHVRGPIPPNRITHGEGQCIYKLLFLHNSSPNVDTLLYLVLVCKECIKPECVHSV